jgi:hypothetical protein
MVDFYSSNHGWKELGLVRDPTNITFISFSYHPLGNMSECLFVEAHHLEGTFEKGYSLETPFEGLWKNQPHYTTFVKDSGQVISSPTRSISHRLGWIYSIRDSKDVI